MHDVVAAHLAAWESFYIIVGSSAGALTGLQFVVMALAADAGLPSSRHTVSAFGTPTVMHFCAVLLVGAIMSTPWRSLSHVALAIGALGAAGVVYGVIVIKRARRQTGYQPDLGDWMWHTALPLAAYVSLLLAAVALQRGPGSALFAVGAAALMLLLVGLHNAWDTVTYVTVGSWRAKEQEGPRRTPPESPAAPGVTG